MVSSSAAYCCNDFLASSADAFTLLSFSFKASYELNAPVVCFLSTCLFKSCNLLFAFSIEAARASKFSTVFAKSLTDGPNIPYHKLVNPSINFITASRAS